MENNCAVNFAKFILNSNYFQYFTNSSNVGTYWPKCHFDYNEGTFHILQSKTHSNTVPFIICCNSNAIDFSSSLLRLAADDQTLKAMKEVLTPAGKSL